LRDRIRFPLLRDKSKVLERSVAGDFISKITDIFLVVLILVNAAVVILETVQSAYEEYRLLFDIIELFSGIVFSIEYLLRLWICTLEKRFKGAIRLIFRSFTQANQRYRACRSRNDSVLMINELKNSLVGSITTAHVIFNGAKIRQAIIA